MYSVVGFILAGILTLVLDATHVVTNPFALVGIFLLAWLVVWAVARSIFKGDIAGIVSAVCDAIADALDDI